jgi:hypothetical protein
MKLDPGMHIGMHLVFFRKSGVTVAMKNISLSYLPWKCIFGSLITITVNKSLILLEWRGKDNFTPLENMNMTGTRILQNLDRLY